MIENTICDESALQQLILDMVTYITNEINRENNKKQYALIGIKRRGAILTDRIKTILTKKYNKKLDVGYCDITLYRDDLSEISDLPQLLGTEIEFDVKHKNIFLIDDVIFTGRTVRAAIDAILDLGRPQKIQLVTVVDRGNRELPIQPDFTAKYLKTELDEIVNVYLKEIDNKDEISVMRKS
jgi:pyrimidine operon attenuation protein/uracil phosphoribosyltransferase